MARIEYRLLRGRDLQVPPKPPPSGGIPRSGEQASDAARKPILCNQELAPDDVCGVVAYDEEEQIARIALIYTQLLVQGRLQRAIVGSSFYVEEAYRSQGVGLSILLKVLGLGLPYVEAGVSAQMRKILEHWPRFKLVDQSPIFQVPVNRAGILQMGKWDLYSQESQVTGFMSDKSLKLRILSGLWQQRRRIAGYGSAGVQVFAPGPALEHCLGELARPRYPVQIPWTRRELELALGGTDPNRRSWLVRLPGIEPRLLSLHRKERALGHGADGQPQLLLETHLSEIYPPSPDTTEVRRLLSFALDQSARMSAQVLQVHAPNSAVLEACSGAGLLSRGRKSIFVALPVGNARLAEVMGKPENWWCRAMSEDEFEESFHADDGPDNACCVPAAGVDGP